MPQIAPENGSSNVNSIVITSVTTLIPLLTTTLLRVHIRQWKMHALGWDDITMIATTVLDVISAGFTIAAGANGFGRHVQTLTTEATIHALKWYDLAQLMNILGIWLVKISICCFLLRIVKGTSSSFTRILYLLAILSTLVNLTLFIIWFVQVKPVSSQWNIREKGKGIPKSVVVGVANMSAGYNMTTDVVCALFPVFFLWNVKINRWRKVGLLSLIGLGLLTSLAALLKIIFLKTDFESQDLTWTPLKVATCAVVEQNVGAILANLPALKPLFSRLLESSMALYKRTQAPQSLPIKLRLSSKPRHNTAPCDQSTFPKGPGSDVRTYRSYQEI